MVNEASGFNSFQTYFIDKDAKNILRKRMSFIAKFFGPGAPKVEPTVTRDVLLEAMQHCTWCSASGDRAAGRLIQATKTNLLPLGEGAITKNVAKGAIHDALSHAYRDERRILGEEAGNPTEKQISQIANRICGQSFELAQRLQAKTCPAANPTANLTP